MADTSDRPDTGTANAEQPEWLKIHVWEPCEDLDHYTVTGDLRLPGSDDHGMSDESNYTAAETFRAQFPDVDFDPEFSCFWAYATTRERADELAGVLRSWRLS